jgi:hypothetical protein
MGDVAVPSLTHATINAKSHLFFIGLSPCSGALLDSDTDGLIVGRIRAYDQVISRSEERLLG